VLDVGNGLAVVVRTASHAIAYDSGPGWSGDADSGNRIVVPFLRGEGVRRLDGLVLSHADDDHAGGAISLAASREPGWLLSPLEPSDPLHGLAGRSMRCEAGMRWNWDGVEFRVLHPAAEIYRADAPKRKENDRSCVLRIATRAGCMLLTGDVEARGEAEMLPRDRAALRCHVLLVPHHGSRTSSTPAFVDAVGPRIGLVSVGHRNRFRHPNEGVIARYNGRGIALRRTDEEGALHLVLPADSSRGIEVAGHARRMRYWSERRRFP
jgi:competence protein ComEC